jgi:hypothetical protein
MPRADYKTCRVCQGHTSQVGPLSHTRLCSNCGHARLKASIVEQANHNGPVFQYWRSRIAASVGARLLDAVEAKP